MANGPMSFDQKYNVIMLLDHVCIQHCHVITSRVQEAVKGNIPYSRRGHDGRKERLGWPIYRKCARQYVNSIVTSRSRDVTSLFRHLPYDVLFKKTRHCFNI